MCPESGRILSEGETYLNIGNSKFKVITLQKWITAPLTSNISPGPYESLSPSHALGCTGPINFENFSDFELDSEDESHSDHSETSDSANPSPATEYLFRKHLFDAQENLKGLSIVQSCIPSHKVKYGGSTLDGQCD